MSPLVFVHGFTGSPACFADVARRLSRAGRGPEIHAPDVLGHGSARDARAERFEDEVSRLARGIAAALAEPAHLVGYSLGARLSLGLLFAHGALFGRATLIGVHPGLADARERASRVEADERWAKLLEQQGVRAFAERWEAQPLFASQRALPAAVREERAAIRRGHAPDGLARALRVLGLGNMPCFEPRLAEVGVPVQVVAGALDPKYCAIATALCTQLGAATLHLVPRAGHDVVLEAPSALAELIQEGPQDE